MENNACWTVARLDDNSAERGHVQRTAVVIYGLTSWSDTIISSGFNGQMIGSSIVYMHTAAISDLKIILVNPDVQRRRWLRHNRRGPVLTVSTTSGNKSIHDRHMFAQESSRGTGTEAPPGTTTAMVRRWLAGSCLTPGMTGFIFGLHRRVSALTALDLGRKRCQ
ncbi:unnamed protein product [Soboliphyme baturini]|uniref:Uncharacterized protein n=1 Tax=Soboliphyme baturini TaxID=241478 RepID=A0A183IQS1_9BILA|nr:unnamed protein product [Soboliphyme baturini]